MENRWHNKCNLGWHSPPPPPPLASSSRVLLEPESRIQMESNIGHYFYPYVAQQQRSADHGMVQESLHPNTSNFTPSTSRSVLGSSFLSLLSGPPMLLQCDLQQLSSPKQYAAPGQFSIEASNVMVSASGSGVLMDPTGKLSGIMGNGLKNASDLWTVVSPRALLSTHRGRSVLPDDLQAAKLNLHSLDLAEAVGHHIVPSTEKVNDFSSPRGGLQACTSLSDVGERPNILSSQHISPEANSFVFNAAAPLTSDYPRVFCLGTSGDLLLSNVGLFGIVCSCHHFHLSVARFCEHSGLVDVNPGNAVHMDSGETIAQWRKVYFHKFGIRVPEDHFGWDWPQGFSPTAGFMKHNASKSNVSRSSNSLEVFGLLGEAVRPRQLCYDASPRSFWTNQKSVNDASANVQLKETQGHSSNFLPKDLIASSQKNLHGIADGRLMECPIPRCSTMSTVDGCGGLSSICQTISAYGDLISNSEDPFMSSQTFQNLRTSGKGSDRGQFNNPKEEISADKFAASSNVDLRLGQPHQQGQMLGNSVPSAIRLPLLNKVGDSQSLLLQDHQISATSKLMDYGQCLQCPTTSPNSGMRMEHNQSCLLNHSFGGHTAIDSTKLRQSKCDAAESSVISTILSQSNIPSGRNGHSKAFNNVVSGSDQLMPRTPHCEAYTTRSDLIKLRNSTDVSKRLMDINGPCLYNHMCGDIRTSGPNSEFYKKMDDSTTFHGFVGVNGKLNRSAACEKNQLSGVPQDASHSVTPFSYSGKGSSIGSTGHLDHNSNRPKSPSMGFSLASSVATQNSAPIFSYKEGNGRCSCMLDENLRLHLLRNTVELSNKQKHRVSCLGMDQEQRNLPSSCYANIQRPVSTPEEQSHGVIPTKWHAASEVAAKSLQPGATCQMPEGLNNWYDLSSCVQGISLQPKESEVQCQLTHNSSNVWPSLRIGGTGNISLSSENGACCQSLPCAYVQNRCCCAIHGELKSCEPKSKTSFNDIKEGVSGSGKTCTLASNSHNNHMSPTSFDLSGNSKIHPPKTIACLASQWRDVPSKVSNMTYVNQPADLPDKRASVTDESVEAGSLKENEMSNISSGSLAPVVTQASIEVDNVGSCTVNAGDTRYADHHAVDEGSEIGKCWSSDDALDSGKSSEFVGIESSVEVGNKSSCGLVNKCKLRDSFRMKRAQNQVYPSEKVERNYKTGKRKRVVKPKMLDASIYASDFSPLHFESPKCYGTKWSCQSSGGFKATLQSGQGTSHAFSASSIGPSSKRKRSVLSAAETLLLKRNCHTLYDYGEGIDDCQKEKLKGIADFLENPDDKSGKKSERDVASYNTSQQSQLLGQHCANVDRSSKFNAAYNSKSSPSRLLSVGNGKKAKPIVCGEFGVISYGDITLDASKSAKIVSLSRVLKAAKRCTLEPELASVNELKNLNLSGECFNGIYAWKKQRNIATRNATVCNEVDSDIVMEERENAGLIVDELFVSDKEIDEGRKKGCNTLDGCFSTQMKLKGKEIRKLNLDEPTIEGKNSGSPKFSSAKILKSAPRSRCRSAKLLEHAKENKCCTVESHTVDVHKPIKEHQCESPVLDSDAFCCVCGSSEGDEINCLLECSQCLIRVHQACYGVSKVPNSCWYCRPCQESARDIVCVLCGYGGGAMTQALQSSIVVKSLLRAWNVLPEYRPKVTNPSEVWKDKLKLFSISGLEVDSTLVLKPLKAEGATTVWKFGLQKQLVSSCSPSNRNARNSITAGLLDSTVKQWVHMVCGLWTPGTRCPNVNTMNAFDVSGVLRRRVNVVCSMCNRPGGSCIKCRVPNCSVQFHPWCAHQKGLLQSEIEGIDNESVGFYGRCLLHELHPQYESCSGPIDAKMTCPGENESTCARTEGYKGRKWEGFQHSLHCQSSHNGGCLVPQEQLNAWLHINGRKPCAKALSKSLITDVESDCRKEYARFKQAKGWKNLVVYKSGIHALGLYTSQFIARGAMVVEYVGEIVGSRVADKREIEYQSWKKLQYKSACYFFRIDKEHIVDATCKGGIARFVNHSCLPNCVAKVISVRNEKKVVFLAERDIYPGEEITYDYHFNREDEGKKIPCFCNSKKCKRYLN